jgi:hypothetical protein
VKLKKNRPKLLEGFRVLQADGCGMAFYAPVEKEISGRTVRGASNKVRLRIASLPDFLVMKAFLSSFHPTANCSLSTTKRQARRQTRAPSPSSPRRTHWSSVATRRAVCSPPPRK